MKLNLNRIPLRTRLLAAAVLAVGLTAALWWGLHPLPPGQRALSSLKSDAEVKVTRAADGWEFAPAQGEAPSTGLVFYPGGHVDARSYAPYAREIASRGYLVVIPVMPFSLAALSPNAANKVMVSHKEISHWALGGHSLGGAMAARYAASHSTKAGGLILLAAYVPWGSDLSKTDVPALSMVGSLDTVVDRQAMVSGQKRLNSAAIFVALPGGNHAQFGDYGVQPGDNWSPTMGPEEQLTQAVEGSVALLGIVERGR